MPCNLPRGDTALAVQTTDMNEFYKQTKYMYIFGHVTSICMKEL